MVAWIFIRGIMSESFHWDDFVNRMSIVFPQDQMITIDIAGNGKYNRMRTPLGIKENIEHLRSQINLQALKDVKKNIVGFSLGAMFGLEWQRSYPNEIQSVVLMNSSSRASVFFQRLQIAALFKIAQASFQKNNFEKEKLIINMTTHLLNSERKNKLARIWSQRANDFPVQSINFFRQLIVGFKMLEPVEHAGSVGSENSKKLLVLCGQKDKVVNPTCSKKIANMLKAQIYIHPAAGHDLTLNDPDWVIERIVNFYLSQ
jgi:pimeloyl-[acyl-carrier protein] methyl ester esterase